MFKNKLNLWIKFRNEFEVPSLRDFNSDWCEYYCRLEKADLDYKTFYLDPDNTDESVFSAEIIYIIGANAALVAFTLWFNYFWGLLAVIGACILIRLFFGLLHTILFVAIPFEKYISKEKKAQKAIAMEQQEFEFIVENSNNGDFDAQVSILEKQISEIKMDDDVRTCIEEFFDFTKNYVRLSKENNLIVDDVKKLIKIYLKEIVSNIKSNALNRENQEIYNKYNDNICNISYKLMISFKEHIDKKLEMNSLPIDASLKTISDMIDIDFGGI